MAAKRTEQQLKDIETRFKAWLGEDVFTFMIGNTRCGVTRVGLAHCTRGAVLMVIGLPFADMIAGVKSAKKRAELEATRLLDLPQQFEGVRVDVMGDD